MSVTHLTSLILSHVSGLKKLTLEQLLNCRQFVTSMMVINLDKLTSRFQIVVRCGTILKKLLSYAFWVHVLLTSPPKKVPICPHVGREQASVLNQSWLGTFGIFEFFPKQKMICCIFYQVNLTGSGFFK